MKPAAVVFGWAGFNAILAAIMFAYGETLQFIGLYAAGVVLTVLVGLSVLLATKRSSGPHWRLPAGSRSAGLLGLAAILFGLGFVFTHWISYLALFPLLLAAFTFNRERLRAGTVPVPTEVRSSPVVPRPRSEHPVLERAARVTTVAVAGARILSALRQGRRRS
ncbi:hypothetical protein [Amycolatopsis taiwanensis]|uniref:Uncharacterized protein n=1 Tax=Amycolatopsis taiwanensis TaxID=342230 RepID=A0A9W6QXN2_9PSEU|nr:hypothetical protein [Amycolatopsis taiwanensis]GLY63947.1 hypothetical protein Atai01_05660 [Amycolatopsis taiwanensis]